MGTNEKILPNLNLKNDDRQQLLNEKDELRRTLKEFFNVYTAIEHKKNLDEMFDLWFLKQEDLQPEFNYLLSIIITYKEIGNIIFTLEKIYKDNENYKFYLK